MSPSSLVFIPPPHASVSSAICPVTSSDFFRPSVSGLYGENFLVAARCRHSPRICFKKCQYSLIKPTTIWTSIIRTAKYKKITLHFNFLSTTHQNTDLTACLFSTCVPRRDATFKAKMKYFKMWNVKTKIVHSWIKRCQLSIKLFGLTKHSIPCCTSRYPDSTIVMKMCGLPAWDSYICWGGSTVYS